MDITNVVSVFPDGDCIILDITPDPIEQKLPVMQAEYMPAHLSMHASLLIPFGGKLHSLYDMDHDPYEGRKVGHRYKNHATRKDFHLNAKKDYKPWQYQVTA